MGAGVPFSPRLRWGADGEQQPQTPRLLMPSEMALPPAFFRTVTRLTSLPFLPTRREMPTRSFSTVGLLIKHSPLRKHSQLPIFGELNLGTTSFRGEGDCHAQHSA